MNNPLLYQIALTLIPQIGCVQARCLLEHFEPQDIFKARKSTLEKMEGIGTVRADSIKKFSDFARVEEEIAFIERHHIQPLFISDKSYPQRLLHCYDAPILLYYRGSAPLNHSRIVAVVGSRMHTEYGKIMTESFLEGLAQADVLVLSGLAYGIDAIAHKTALKNQMETVGVLAHGLDKIYPSSHATLAREMVGRGGLLTEFTTQTMPDRHHFPSRNRIVAGMSDATVVIETDIKGGSMITAELANGYNRDVFAIPGKTTDKKSTGCNFLIKNNKAILLTDSQQFLETMGWTPPSSTPKKKNRELFITLSPAEKCIVDLLNERGQTSIDEINFLSQMSSSTVAAAILNLEVQQIIVSLPGKQYRLL